MDVEYKSKSLARVCTDAHEAERHHGVRMAELIHQRISEIQSADSIKMMLQYEIGGCHPLHGNRKGQYAVSLVHPYRLIFVQKGIEVQIVRIIEIVDYH